MAQNEEHAGADISPKSPLFGISFMPQASPEGGYASLQSEYDGAPPQPLIFATLGGNTVLIAGCYPKNKIEILQAFHSGDDDEDFYTCVWTVRSDTREPILCVAGHKGIIRVLTVSQKGVFINMLGHGGAVNDLRVHPLRPELIVSASKDHSLRLWNVPTWYRDIKCAVSPIEMAGLNNLMSRNVMTGVCLAKFGGVEGHRDEVLGCDFSTNGDDIMSCGMDHSLKVWNISSEQMHKQMDAAAQHDTFERSLPMLSEHFPKFSTRQIHGNYVDCIRCYGNLYLSKSCENEIVCWKPGCLNEEAEIAEPDDVSILHKFPLVDCNVWYMKFSLDPTKTKMAVGSLYGKVTLFDLSVDEGQKSSGNFKFQSVTLGQAKCKSPVRQIALSPNADIVLACCDDATVWRWDRI